MIRVLLLSLITLAAALPAQLSYTKLSAGTTQPSGRVDGTVAYDPAGRRLIMFGGDDGSTKNDLWVYALDRRTWTEIQTTGARPPVRFGHTLAIDSRGRAIVFGGQGSGFLSDVWAFDFAKSSWQQLSPNEAGPSRRYGHSAIYDARRDRLVISHGFTNSGRFDDTWAFDLAANRWQNLNPDGQKPLRRCLHHAVYYAAGDRMYLYGGCSSGAGPCPQGDLWSYDLQGNRWTQIVGSVTPPPRQLFGMAFDEKRKRLVIFGGSGIGVLGDTWEFDPQTSTWSQPTLGATVPSPRSRHQGAYAEDQGLVFFFGGSGEISRSNELWTLHPEAAAPRPQISKAGVLNAFSNGEGPLSPGQIVSIYGAGLGPNPGVALSFDAQSGKLPLSAASTSVTLNSVPAPIFFAGAEQINVQVPYELAASQEAELIVTSNGQTSEAIRIPVAPSSIGLHPNRYNQDATLNGPENAAARGSVIVLYATGQGVTSPASVTGAFPVGTYPEPLASIKLSIGGIEAPISFRGQAPGTAGVMQINATIPFAVSPGNDIPAVLSIGGDTSQTIRLAIR